MNRVVGHASDLVVLWRLKVRWMIIIGVETYLLQIEDRISSPA